MRQRKRSTNHWGVRGHVAVWPTRTAHRRLRSCFGKGQGSEGSATYSLLGSH